MNWLRVTLILVLVGCTEKPQVQLGDGFRYVRSAGSVHSIAKSNGESLIYGDVQGVNDAGQYITGLRIPADPPIHFPKGFADQPYGYFIYDKKTDKLILGLSETEFNDYLKSFSEIQK